MPSFDKDTLRQAKESYFYDRLNRLVAGKELLEADRAWLESNLEWFNDRAKVLSDQLTECNAWQKRITDRLNGIRCHNVKHTSGGWKPLVPTPPPYEYVWLKFMDGTIVEARYVPSSSGPGIYGSWHYSTGERVRASLSGWRKNFWEEEGK